MAKKAATSPSKITHAEVRMYRMGTGDCFVLKFFAQAVNTFTMMIDCGTWQNNKVNLDACVRDLKTYVNNKVDVLVVTHEHKDHVYGFELCSDLFIDDPDFTVKAIWMAWTENDTPGSDTLSDQVRDWKSKFGQHKKALSLAARQLNSVYNSVEQQDQVRNEPNTFAALSIYQGYADAVQQFADLHLSAAEDDSDNDANYVGGLKGMKVVKEKLAKNNISYFHPKQLFDNIEGATGLRFYVLGPPTSIGAITTESGPEGETYAHSHNTDGADNDSFATALLNLDAKHPPASLFPFDKAYELPAAADAKPTNLQQVYAEETWRQIDHDWLNSAGSLALRMNSATNNLSLALAIEFVDSGRVMLFPGDAEYGSWDSWHQIDWPIKGKDGKTHLTTDLLNRTVFYKVAHHLSHNGSARRRGVELMNHPDLAAMATLDYGRISKGWKNTMPNRDLVQALLTRTKGRLMIMQEKDLIVVGPGGTKTPLHDKIAEARQQMNSTDKADFARAFKENPLYLQYTVQA